MQLKPERSCRVVAACAVLHNMARRHNLPDPEELDIAEEGDDGHLGGNPGNDERRGIVLGID